MTSRIVIENLISLIRKQLAILDKFRSMPKERLVGDDIIRGSVERYLYLAIQATIDLAEATIAYKKLRKPSTLSESFYILDEAEIVSKELSEKLVKMVGFRNVIAHDYVKIDYDIVYTVLMERYKDIEEFLSVVEGL